MYRLPTAPVSARHDLRLRTVGRRISAVNRMDRLAWDSTLVNVFTFTGADRTDSRTYRTGTSPNVLVAETNYKFDAFGRMNEIDATDTVGAHVVDFRRAYDYNGNPLYTEYAHKTTRSEIYGTQTGGSPEGPADALNRLTRYRRGTLNANKDDLTATVFEQDWHDTQGVLRLDKLGNWDMVRTDTTGGGTFTVETKGHNLANEYTSKNGQSFFAHDDDGNLTDDGTYTFSYDFANHLVKAVRKSDSATIGEYLYDALGRRVKKVVTNTDTYDGTTLFYYDGLRVREEGKLDGNNAYKATHQYVWGLYLDELLLYDYDSDADGDFDAVDQQGGDMRCFASQDFLYSAAALVNCASAVQERCDCGPYGAPTFWNASYTATTNVSQRHNTFLFTGQSGDSEVQLYNYKARRLLPTVGRFAQRDPAADRQRVSLYQYVASRPTLFTDKTGMRITTSVACSGKMLTVRSDYCCARDHTVIETSLCDAYKTLVSARDALWAVMQGDYNTPGYAESVARLRSFFTVPEPNHYTSDLGAYMGDARTASIIQPKIFAVADYLERKGESFKCVGQCGNDLSAYVHLPWGGTVRICESFLWRSNQDWRTQAIIHEEMHWVNAAEDFGTYVAVIDGTPRYEDEEGNEVKGPILEDRVSHASTLGWFVMQWYVP